MVSFKVVVKAVLDNRYSFHVFATTTLHATHKLNAIFTDKPSVFAWCFMPSSLSQ